MRKPMKEVEHIQCFRGLLDMLSFDECVTNLPVSHMGCDLAHIFDGSLVQQWQLEGGALTPTLRVFASHEICQSIWPILRSLGSVTRENLGCWALATAQR